MNYILLILALLALFPLASPAAAWDVLVVQKYRAKPYADVVRGFRVGCRRQDLRSDP